MAGLFNADTQLEALLQRQREQNQAQQQQFGKLYGNAARNRSQAAANTIGAQVGASFGQGLAGGLLGEPDEIKRARGLVDEEQSLQNQLGNLDPKDPSSYLKIGQALNKAGLTEQGIAFMEKGRAIEQAANEAILERRSKNTAANYFISKDKPGIASLVEQGALTAKEAFEVTKEEGSDINVESFGNYVDSNTGKVFTGAIRTDKKGNIEQVIRKDGQWVKAPDSVVKEGAPDLSVTIDQQDKFGNMTKLSDDYRQDMTSIKEDSNNIDSLETDLQIGTKQNIESGLTTAFGNSAKAVSELERWANLGNLGESAVNSIKRFVSGDYSEANKRIVERAIAAKRDEIADKWQNTNNLFKAKADYGSVDPSIVLSEVPYPNYKEMDMNTLLSIDESGLSSIEKIRYDNALAKEEQRLKNGR